MARATYKKMKHKSRIISADLEEYSRVQEKIAEKERQIQEEMEKQKNESSIQEENIKNKRKKKQSKPKDQIENVVEDKVLNDIHQARINFKETIKQVAKMKAVETKTDWHYRMKESVEHDQEKSYEYAGVVSKLLKKCSIEER